MQLEPISNRQDESRMLITKFSGTEKGTLNSNTILMHRPLNYFKVNFLHSHTLFVKLESTQHN